MITITKEEEGGETSLTERELQLVTPTQLLIPSPLPTAPVLYAVISNALVPPPIRRVSVKVTAVADSDGNPSSSSVHVRFKTSWILDPSFSLVPFTLAVPVGAKGTLVRCGVKSSYFSRSLLHNFEYDDKFKAQLQDVYLVPLPPVEVLRKDTEICILVHYVQDFDMIDYDQGLYLFRVPLSIPSYVNYYPPKMLVLAAQKIRLVLECKGAGTIKSCDITSHPLIDMFTDKRRRIFRLQSRWYSEKDLICSFRVM